MGNTINIEKIKNYMEANGFSKAAFCKKCNFYKKIHQKMHIFANKCKIYNILF